MVYLHILGKGTTKPAIADSKGHLFEYLVRALFDHLKMSITYMNKSENGKEIDLEGETIVGKWKFFAECKAQEDPLDSTDVQKFGFKFLTKRNKDQAVRGFLFTLSQLNPKAQEVWDGDLKTQYGDQVICYHHDDIVNLLIEYYKLADPSVIREATSKKYDRVCGDTQILCVEGEKKTSALFWAQLLMSTDGTEPNAVVLYSSNGSLVTEKGTIDHILGLKRDLSSTKIACLNQSGTTASRLATESPSRTVVRVRKSSDWFDYRFPASPEFFVGRGTQLAEMKEFISDVKHARTSSRGFLISGKSGIGKSSLALKARQLLLDEKVIYLPIDSRLCDDESFIFDSVNELLLELRQTPSLGAALMDVRVQGLDSLIGTLTQISNVMATQEYLAVLFFDQFERVFEYPEVTRVIRSLFLRATEKQLAIVFGFAWKSDLWSPAEGFPHNERDDIVRESFAVRPLEQFGQEETSQILKQLEVRWGGKLNTFLSHQLATFSRGLPWLLKRVCAHILEQKSRGVTEHELIETNLKLQDLFEADLAGLDDEERSLLKSIAPMLPTTLLRLSESFEIPNIDRSLLRFIDKRILVQITEDVGDSPSNLKYDAYSDIFREFLITGKVPIDDAYYFYTYPRGALKFFEKVRSRKRLPIRTEIKETGKQMASIYNLSRDLRSLGLVDLRKKTFTITEDAKGIEPKEIPVFIQTHLKRNRVVSLILSELNDTEKISLTRVAEILKELFPSIQAAEKTWAFYSKTTAQWLNYTRLAFLNKREGYLHRVHDEAVFETFVERGTLSSTGFYFPQCFRNAIIECLEAMFSSSGNSSITELMQLLSLSHQSVEKSLSDNLKLGFVSYDIEHKSYRLTPIGTEFVQATEQRRKQIFNRQSQTIPVFSQFVSQIEAAGQSGISSKRAATAIVQAMNTRLAETTIEKLGMMLANWAEFSELIVRRGKQCYMKEYFGIQLQMY